MLDDNAVEERVSEVVSSRRSFATEITSKDTRFVLQYSRKVAQSSWLDKVEASSVATVLLVLYTQIPKGCRYRSANDSIRILDEYCVGYPNHRQPSFIELPNRPEGRRNHDWVLSHVHLPLTPPPHYLLYLRFYMHLVCFQTALQSPTAALENPDSIVRQAHNPGENWDVSKLALLDRAFHF